MNISVRMRELIDTLGISIYKLANDSGISSQTLTNNINRGVTPNSETISKILLLYKDVNARWLLTGEGEMFDTAVVETKEIKPKQYEPIDEKVNLMKEKEPFYMMVQVDYLKNMLAEKERIIKSKEETIETLINSINK